MLYGFLSLEALSGLAPFLLLLIVMMAVLASRLPNQPRIAVLAAGAFVTGFVVLWRAFLAYCCGVWIDVMWAAGFLVVGLAPSAAVWIVMTLLRSRASQGTKP